MTTIDKTTIYEGVIGDTIRVDRRRSDGMVWLRVEDRHGGKSHVVALDSDQAWGLARALMQAPEPLIDITPDSAPNRGERMSAYIKCGSDGGYGAPQSHRCECNRRAGDPLDSARPHGCSCGAPWSCADCDDETIYGDEPGTRRGRTTR